MVAALLALSAASPDTPGRTVIDKGSFKVSRHDRPLGAETFEMVQSNDSLMVLASQFLTLQGPEGPEPLERAAQLLLNQNDFSLRNYRSTRTHRAATTQRELVVADTHYVAYRQHGLAGTGESRVLPPGRVYVMDAQLITLFDLIGRSLQGTTFESRPLNLLALGPRDTMLDARVVSLGTETIRWGAKPVQARKLNIVADSQTTFTLWMSPRGQLLRLVEPVGGLRADRDAPPVKKATSSAPPKPGG